MLHAYPPWLLKAGVQNSRDSQLLKCDLVAKQLNPIVIEIFQQGGSREIFLTRDYDTPHIAGGELSPEGIQIT